MWALRLDVDGIQRGETLLAAATPLQKFEWRQADMHPITCGRLLSAVSDLINSEFRFTSSILVATVTIDVTLKVDGI